MKEGGSGVGGGQCMTERESGVGDDEDTPRIRYTVSQYRRRVPVTPLTIITEVIIPLLFQARTCCPDAANHSVCKTPVEEDIDHGAPG